MQFSADQLLKCTVYDPSGSKVGTIQQVYLDDATGEPSWVTVRTGFFGTNESLVPLAGARVNGDVLEVQQPKNVIKDAPNYDPGHHLDESDEADLHRYYGTTPAETGREQDRDRGREHDRDRGRDHDSLREHDRSRDRDRDRDHDSLREHGDPREHASGDPVVLPTPDRAPSDPAHASGDPVAVPAPERTQSREDPSYRRDDDRTDDRDATTADPHDSGRERELLDRERQLLDRERDLLDRERSLTERQGSRGSRLRRHNPST